MRKKNISGVYLDGIREGRELLKLTTDCTSKDIERFITNAKLMTAKSEFALKDFYQGKLDFWKEQLKKY